MDYDRCNGMRASMPYSHSGPMSCFFKKQNSVQIRRELRLMDITPRSARLPLPHIWGVTTISRIPPTGVATSVVPNRRFTAEGRTVLSIYPKLAILNVYIPQGNRDGRNLDYKLDCLTALKDFVRQWAGPPLLLCGDFNIARAERDLARPSANIGHVMFTTQERALFEELLAVGYVDCLRELYPEENGIYSWWPYAFSARTRNLGWRLDYVLVPADLRNRIIEIRHRTDLLGSDHCPIELNLNAELK
jgi:exodeoxyribonuclease-3